MRIGELAKLTGKSGPTLRYYEQLGLLPAPERTESGYREYPPATVERVRFIGKAQERGFSLDEITAVLALHDRGQPACERVVEMARGKLLDLEKRIAELQQRHAMLSAALRHWESGGYAQGSHGVGVGRTAEGPYCPILATAAMTEERGTNMARKVEVFTAGCPLCDPVVEMVRRVACRVPSGRCEVTVHNLKEDPQAAERAQQAGVQRVPMVLVDGRPAECCQAGPVTEAGLRAAGVGA